MNAFTSSWRSSRETMLLGWMLCSIRTAGVSGIGLRNLNFLAKQARQIAGDLVQAGLIEERRLNQAEWFAAVEHVGEQP